jgi:leader peptidase (prepilin peptidase)/N-methyltransferase
VDSILGAFIGFSFFYLIEKIYRFLKDADGLGRGDAKVFSSMGALMGWQSLPYILLAGSLLALLSAFLFYLLKKKKLTDLKAETIPFVPALSFGLLINIF